jgi:hypothetical protein
MRIDHYIHDSRSKEAPPWAEQLADQLGLALTKLEIIMSTLEELTGVLGEIGAEVEKVSADTDKLLADLAAIPTPGMTPEQQAAVDAAVVSATAIRDRLKALDDKVPEAS